MHVNMRSSIGRFFKTVQMLKIFQTLNELYEMLACQGNHLEGGT